MHYVNMQAAGAAQYTSDSIAYRSAQLLAKDHYSLHQSDCAVLMQAAETAEYNSGRVSYRSAQLLARDQLREQQRLAQQELQAQQEARLAAIRARLGCSRCSKVPFQVNQCTFSCKHGRKPGQQPYVLRHAALCQVRRQVTNTLPASLLPSAFTSMCAGWSGAPAGPYHSLDVEGGKSDWCI